MRSYQFWDVIYALSKRSSAISRICPIEKLPIFGVILPSLRASSRHTQAIIHPNGVVLAGGHIGSTPSVVTFCTLAQVGLRMKNCEQFAHRIDICDSNSGDVIEHLAYIDDYLLAIATYRAARQRWPDAYIELWQGKRIIWHTRHNQLL
jgi:hypothetical protein